MVDVGPDSWGLEQGCCYKLNRIHRNHTGISKSLCKPVTDWAAPQVSKDWTFWSKWRSFSTRRTGESARLEVPQRWTTGSLTSGRGDEHSSIKSPDAHQSPISSILWLTESSQDERIPRCSFGTKTSTKQEVLISSLWTCLCAASYK